MKSQAPHVPLLLPSKDRAWSELLLALQESYQQGRAADYSELRRRLVQLHHGALLVDT